MNSIFSPADFSDLPEFGVGHYTNMEALTGCTCFVARGKCAEGATCGVDVRGGGPATRETDLLRPENMVQKVNAVMLSGGSAFGLETANGAMRVLDREGMGFNVGPVRVPIVPAACIFDLLRGKPVWPTIDDGAYACEKALKMDSASLAMGVVGAGTGAMVGQMGMPDQASKSGFGWSGLCFGELVVIACVVVNAAGNVVAEDGRWLAGVHDEDDVVLDPLLAAMSATEKMHELPSTGVSGEIADELSSNTAGHTTNTTLGVVLTNASLTKAQATKVSQQAQNGYARAIKPVHTLNDGDTIFTMASGTLDSSIGFFDFLPDLVGIMAADAMEDAIRKAVEIA